MTWLTHRPRARTRTITQANMLKIAVKALIESSVGIHGVLHEAQYPQLQHLCVLIESLFKHGLKDRKKGYAVLFELYVHTHTHF
jgi:hypothetical protein